MVYGLLVLEAGVPEADEVFDLVALTIVLFIVAHSSTDIVVARSFERGGGYRGWRSTLRAAAGRCAADRNGSERDEDALR